MQNSFSKNGVLKEAASLIKKQLLQAPKVETHWHKLALNYALQKSPHDFIDTIEAAAEHIDIKIDFIINIFLDLISYPSGYSCVELLSKKLPKNKPSQVISLYYAGCSKLMQNNYLAAFNYFSLFINNILKQKQNFPMIDSSNMNIIFRQAFLIENPATVQQICNQEETSFPTYNPELLYDAQPVISENANTAVLISCCNGIYFDHFGSDFINSVIKYCPTRILHIHIAESTKMSRQIIKRFRNEYPDFKLNFSTEQNSPFTESVYFSCIRFLLTESLLRFYKSKIIFFDIDCELTTSLTPFENLTDGSHFSCFSSGRFEPASIYQAGLTCFSYSNQTISFVQVLKKFILIKLSLPIGVSWMLDQAALFSVIRFMSTNDNFKFKDISTASKFKMNDFLKLYENTQKKLALMRRGSIFHD